MSLQTEEVNWERLDKRKFFVDGAAVFTCLTAGLFPLSVIKTRMMALDGAHRGLRGAILTARDVVRHDGVRGLYKGFGTVLCGLIPARVLYLGALEASKAGTTALLSKDPQLSDTFIATIASFVGGGTASLASQLVIVPVDVISQRLMISGGGSSRADSTSLPGSPHSDRRLNGMQLARQIIKSDGILGLYRGFGASIATLVPSSAIWWSAYGTWQTVLWHQIDSWNRYSRVHGNTKNRIEDNGSNASVSSESRKSQIGGEQEYPKSEGTVLAVQAVAGVLTGCTSATLTMPLDVIKTRLQTSHSATVADGTGKPTWMSTAKVLYKNEGAKGFFRGVAPRMVSTSIWGTVMVTAYEALKRLCVIPEKE